MSMVFGKYGSIGKNVASRVVVATSHATETAQDHLSMVKIVLDHENKFEIVI